MTLQDLIYAKYYLAIRGRLSGAPNVINALSLWVPLFKEQEATYHTFRVKHHYVHNVFFVFLLINVLSILRCGHGSKFKICNIQYIWCRASGAILASGTWNLAMVMKSPWFRKNQGSSLAVQQTRFPLFILILSRLSFCLWRSTSECFIGCTGHLVSVRPSECVRPVYSVYSGWSAAQGATKDGF